MEMENDSEDHFRKLLKKAAINRPNADFTKSVMQKISMEAQYVAISEENALKLLLQNIKPQQPTAAFTDNVLRALQPAPVIQYRPIISKKAWYWIAAVATLIIIACFGFLGETPEQAPRFIGLIDQAARSTFIISSKMNSLPELYSLAIIGLASLMLFDYFIRVKMQNAKRLAKS